MPPKTFGLTSSRGRGTSSSSSSSSYRGNSSNTNYRGRFRGRGRGGSSYRGRGGSSSSSYNLSSSNNNRDSAAGGRGGDGVKRADDGTQLAERFESVRVNDEVDEKLGFARVSGGESREGWLINMHPTLLKDPDWPSGKAAVDFYFLQDDGDMFKCTIAYEPYILIACKQGTEPTVEEYLKKTYDTLLAHISRITKEDLNLPNHLMGHRRLFLQLHFHNVSDLLAVRRELLPLAEENGRKRDAVDAYAEVVGAAAAAGGGTGGGGGGGGTSYASGGGGGGWGLSGEDAMDWEAGSGVGVGGGRGGGMDKGLDPRECIVDIREYDVPYYLRVAIDHDVRVGLWYSVSFPSSSSSGHRSSNTTNTTFSTSSSTSSTTSLTNPTFTPLPHRVKRADPVVLAYDIETTKAPLKFPDAAVDVVMMISYMVDGQGYLVVNREIVSEDIEDFEYTPKEGYEGPFVVFNEVDEAATITRFFNHIRLLKPTILATFNGDFFDFPFLHARSQTHSISMFLETGFTKDSEDEYKSRTCVHMDCFRWVKRDSYLPQGSQGLKAVTTSKLGYSPIELDPELMTPYALEQPQVLAQYSVSDAVATYYLYMKYVHPFIFSLCNIIPLNPDEVLRKGSGTLCETLLMVEAYRGHIIMPNRHTEGHGNMYEGHLLSSETYVGGHVEALEAGVFRSDIETDFKIVPEAVQGLIDDLDSALKFYITEECHTPLSKVTNYPQVHSSILTSLQSLLATPHLKAKPLIYHLDVAAMYPNIMLSNRLQPDSMIDESVCAVCDYNRPGKTCDRRMEWAWRGEYFPAQRDELNMIRHALNQETFPAKWKDGPRRRFDDLSEAEKSALVEKRLGDYSRKVYKKTKETRVETREAIVCQRENPFYVDTVRTFRDRRYEYKGLLKTWKKNLDKFQEEGRGVAEVDEAKKLIVIYDSLQLAHKCILNSFYGYVMRKGARWHSMEMAGITCLTGARIIQMARQLVERIGRPLELDTDGIWCMLPGSFPENFKFTLDDGKSLPISYPCTMLNHLVHARFTNEQYHELDRSTGVYNVRKENSIFFELDGPYRAMILPSSKEEDKLLKKRYAVFNDDGSLAELKGFEVKRRGELQLIKIFQSAIFERFLLGSTIESCYAAVATVADQWLDVLYTKGAKLSDEELVELIAENRSMSKTLAEYAGQKSTSISTARRLAEFLGDGMTKDKGLACRFIISLKPTGAPVTERAVPLAIFSAPLATKRTYLRKWLKDPGLVTFELREILDWEYYIERLGSVIMKLVTIPAAMQGVANPVPRVRHPEWLKKRVEGRVGPRQREVTEFFKRRVAVVGDEEKQGEGEVGDIEDAGFGGGGDSQTQKSQSQVLGMQQPRRVVVTKRKTQRQSQQTTDSPQEDVEIPLPDPNTNYSAWLKVMKATRWRKLRERQSFQTASGVSAFFGGSAASASASASAGGPGAGLGLGLGGLGRPQPPPRWDIVQFKESSTHGRYLMWVSVNGQLTAVPVRIPRTFYVHLRSGAPGLSALSMTRGASGGSGKSVADEVFRREEYEADKVSKVLPRNMPCRELYRVVVKEEKYREMEEHFVEVVNNPRVEGVFEQQVPLAMRAILKLGKTCTAEEFGMTLRRAESYGLDLEQLSPPSANNTNTSSISSNKPARYLETVGRQIFFYHACAASSPLHVFALFIPDSSAVKLHIVDPATRRQPIPSLEKLYSELEKKHRNKHGFSTSTAFPPSLTFNTTYHRNDTAALKAISRDLGLVEDRSFTVVISSSKDASYFDTSIPKLSKFPSLHMSKLRSAHSLDTYPWQSHVGTKMITRFLSLGPWLDKLISLATYYDCPIGHIDGDHPLQLTDLTLARRLVAQDFILWWSPSDRPDLGGVEMDRRPVEDLPGTEFMTPGAYANVCMELGVRNLAVDAVLHAGVVNELEGSGGATAFDSTSRTIEEMGGGAASGTASGAGTGAGTGGGDATSGQTQQRDLSLGESHVSPLTFNIIRSMLKSWMFDKIQSDYTSPSTLGVDHFWRWVSSPTSHLYDPAIHRFVHALMRKTFLQLLAEFKRLGSTVVYADFSRLILATSKPPGTAHAYATYITTAVTSHELFQHVYLSHERFWDYLIFMDEANMSGIICEDPLALEPPLVPCLGMFWNIREFLPRACQKGFFDAVKVLTVELFRLREEANKRGRVPLRVMDRNMHSGEGEEDGEGDEHDGYGVDGGKSVEITAMRDLISQKLTRHLLKLIGRITSEYKLALQGDEELLSSYTFPILPGSHLHFTNPALELIKSVTAVCGLVREVETEVGLMKRTLLELVGVKAFSQDAGWRNPCAPLKVVNVPCRHCDAMRNFDFCRDADLLHSSTQQEGGDSAGAGAMGATGVAGAQPKWYCGGERCGGEYDRTAMEFSLLAMVQEMERTFAQQDLRCSKCKQIQSDSVSRFCKCSGVYQFTLSKVEARRRLRTIVNVGIVHGFGRLKECAQILLDNW